MAELNRNGHRQRVKEVYLKNSADSFPDHNLLELVLFYAIPQKDVKPIAYELINHFGSFENVFNADINELVKVNGIKEHAAILISLFREVNKRIDSNVADNKLNSFVKMEEYVSRKLRSYKNEVMLVVTLDNANSVINAYIIESGTVNMASISKRKLSEFVIRDNASAVVFGHNHPNGAPTPSAADIDMTAELTRFLRSIGIKLHDHIIVGKGGESESLKSNLKYSLYFD